MWTDQKDLICKRKKLSVGNERGGAAAGAVTCSTRQDSPALDKVCDYCFKTASFQGRVNQ